MCSPFLFKIFLGKGALTPCLVAARSPRWFVGDPTSLARDNIYMDMLMLEPCHLRWGLQKQQGLHFSMEKYRQIPVRPFTKTVLFLDPVLTVKRCFRVATVMEKSWNFWN